MQPQFEHCVCPQEGLQVCLRTVSKGAVHMVRQCRTCGRQIGGPLSRKLLDDAQASALPHFDASIEERYHALRLEAAERERATVSELPAGPTAQRMAAERQASQEVAELVRRLSTRLAPDQVANALTTEAVAIRRALQASARATMPRFVDEPDLKQWLADHLSQDFELTAEVTGRHLAENVHVEIDFMAYPKPHLIEAGFVPWHFGIEVKHFNQNDGFSRKASRALWQTVSYTDSEFEIAGSAVRPRFALLFSNLSFESERSLLKNFGRLTENDWVLWRGLLQLANHANVGTLDIKGTASAWQGWIMRFSTGGTYFLRRHGNRLGEPVYRESNRDLVEKVRIGNF